MYLGPYLVSTHLMHKTAQRCFLLDLEHTWKNPTSQGKKLLNFVTSNFLSSRPPHQFFAKKSAKWVTLSSATVQDIIGQKLVPAVLLQFGSHCVVMDSSGQNWVALRSNGWDWLPNAPLPESANYVRLCNWLELASPTAPGDPDLDSPPPSWLHLTTWPLCGSALDQVFIC